MSSILSNDYICTVYFADFDSCFWMLPWFEKSTRWRRFVFRRSMILLSSNSTSIDMRHRVATMCQCRRLTLLIVLVLCRSRALAFTNTKFMKDTSALRIPNEIRYNFLLFGLSARQQTSQQQDAKTYTITKRNGYSNTGSKPTPSTLKKTNKSYFNSTQFSPHPAPSSSTSTTRQSRNGPKEKFNVTLLLIDHYDSFTYNLYDMLAQCTVEPPIVLSKDAFDNWPTSK